MIVQILEAASLLILLTIAWLPIFKRLTQFPRLVIMLLVSLLVLGLFSREIAMLYLIMYFIRIVILMIFEKKVYYSCHRCGFKKGFEQKLKLYKCPQCEEENIVNEGN